MDEWLIRQLTDAKLPHSILKGEVGEWLKPPVC